MPISALELDTSVDEEIRKNYNPSKLELENLPPIPNVSPNTPVFKPLPELQPANNKPVISNIDKSTAIKIKKGTKFKVISNQRISDTMGIGSRITFVSQNSVTQRYITIPQGTVFKGEIIDSHSPQYSGNGGLIVLKIDSLIYKGATHGLNAKITKVGDKKIFVNNIKGERKYWKNTLKQINKGQSFYKKTRRASNKLADNPIGIIIAPIPTLFGMGTYAINFVGSPVISLFNKGGSVIIPAGTSLEIKLLDDAYLNY